MMNLVLRLRTVLTREAVQNSRYQPLAYQFHTAVPQADILRAASNWSDPERVTPSSAKDYQSTPPTGGVHGGRENTSRGGATHGYEEAGWSAWHGGRLPSRFGDDRRSPIRG